MRRTATALALVLLSLPPAAHADSTPAADFNRAFGTRAPAAATSMAFRIVYKNPDNPNAAPSPQRRIVIELPQGTRIDGNAVPVCTASDAELQALGPSACPAGSRVGGGTAELRTDGGPAFDPFIDDVDIFNGGKELVELFTHQGDGVRIGVGRRQMTSPDTLTETPPPQPGAPPDFESSVRVLDFKFAASPFITTPAGCPADGEWRSKLTFDTADGHTYTASSTTPCDPDAAPAAPAHTGACRSRRVVPVRLSHPARVTILRDGKVVRRLRRPRTVIPVDLRGLPRGSYRYTLVIGERGATRRMTRVFRTCGA